MRDFFTRTGNKNQLADCTEAREPHSSHGCHHGILLPVLLDALWGSSPAGHLRQKRSDHSNTERGTISSGQEQHCCQPCHLCAFQQSGE